MMLKYVKVGLKRSPYRSRKLLESRGYNRKCERCSIKNITDDLLMTKVENVWQQRSSGLFLVIRKCNQVF